MRRTKTKHSRREFLRVSTAGVASALASTMSIGCTGDPKKQRQPKALIDAHTHFYDPTRPEGVPWPGKNDKQLYRRVMPEHFRALTEPLGVTGTIVVEASPWVEDNQWLLDLAENETIVVGIVGRLNPGTDDFAKHLRRFARHRLFRGIRINHGELRGRLNDASYLDDLKQLADADLALDVNGGPEMLGDVVQLVQAIPQLRVVINHAANVPIDGKAVSPAWLAGMQALAERNNVFCKVSALVEATGQADGQAPREVAYYRPVLDALWDAFGVDRLIYGSNWPVSERFASYETVLGIVQEFFQAKGSVANDRFFFHNAQSAYQWVKRT